MAKKKGKGPYIEARYIFCLNMYGLKKKKIENQKNWEIRTETIFCFAILALYFLLFLHLCRNLNICIFFVKRKGLSLAKVQTYSINRRRNIENKDIFLLTMVFSF